MYWIYLAVAAQFLNALTALVDKRVVSDDAILPRPFVYAFYTCIISGLWILVYAFGFFPFAEALKIPSFDAIKRPTLEVVALAFLSAYTFFTALVSMFTALREGDASDVVPVIGATSAVASFGLSYFFLDTQLSHNFIIGIVLLAGGTFLVSRFHFHAHTAMYAIHAGIFFALHYISIKGLFVTTSFEDGFFWSRIALMLYAGSLLLIPTFYEKITEQTKITSKRAGFLILANKILAGISSIMILKATDLGDVAVVQALGGLQFIFILVIGFFFHKHVRHAVGVDRFRPELILQKVLFVTIITIGFLILFI